MALLTVGQIIKRVGALLDDPSNRRFSPDYLRPYVDQENESFEITLERLGIQQQEQIAIFNLPAATTAPVDLAPYFQPGQPLQYLLRPKRIDWKVQGMPDTAYTQSTAVDELDDTLNGNVGCQEYRWGAGSIQLVPSYTAVTLRVYFFALNTDIYDDAAPVMRGVGNILALQVAAFVCSLNNNMGKLGDKLERSLARDKQNLSNLLVMQAQAQTVVPRGSQGRNLIQISSGGKPLL